MVFHWNLKDSKSPQISRTLLSSLVVLNNILIWMVTTRPPTSKFSSLFNSPLVTVPNEHITIGIIITFMFLSFLIPWQGFGTYSSFYFLSVLLLDQLGQQTPQFCKFSFFFFFFVDYFWPRLGDPFVCQSPIGICVSNSSGLMLGCAYTIRSDGQI